MIITTSVAKVIIITIVSKTDMATPPFVIAYRKTLQRRECADPHKKIRLLHILIISLLPNFKRLTRNYIPFDISKRTMRQEDRFLSPPLFIDLYDVVGILASK